MDLIKEISKYGLTIEQYEECLQMIIDKKNNIKDLEWKDICNMYGLNISVDALRKANGTIFGGAFIAEYFKNKIVENDACNNLTHEDVDDLKNTFSETSINKDGTYSSSRLLVMNEMESKDPNFILKANGFDTSCWSIVSLRNNIRQVISKQDGVVTLYASFLTVKPVVDLTLEQIENFYKELVEKYPTPAVKKEE